MITVAHVQIGQFITHSKFNRGRKTGAATLFVSALPLFASFVNFFMVTGSGSRWVRWLCF
ncbi:MAG: hypothetical protein VB142_10745 [Burkholderia sp.]